MRRTFAIDLLGCAEAGVVSGGWRLSTHRTTREKSSTASACPHALPPFSRTYAVCDAKTGSSYRGDTMRTMRRPLEGHILSRYSSPIHKLRYLSSIGVDAMRK